MQFSPILYVAMPGSYPFVSQTMFQGFSCRQLDVNESYLDVGEIQLPIPALLFVKIDN